MGHLDLDLRRALGSDVVDGELAGDLVDDAPLAFLAALSAEALGPGSDIWPRAEDYYRRAVVLDGGNPGYRRRLGAHLIRLRKLEEAEAVFTELTDEDPRDGQSWFLLGRIARSKGEKEKAVEAVRTAVQLEPENKNYGKVLNDLEKER